MPTLDKSQCRANAALLFGALLLWASLAARLAAQQPSIPNVGTPQGLRVTLHGNTHPLTRIAADEGMISGSTSLQRMLLVLRRTPAQEVALDQLLAQQQDPASPNFHQWLTPQVFGVRFGPSNADLAALTSWLEASGFTGIQPNPGRTVIEFSGTEALFEQAFHTALHNYRHQGTVYTANAADPEVPTAFASLIAGFTSLNNFPRNSTIRNSGIVRRDPITGKLARVDNAPSASPATPHPDFTYASGGEPLFGIAPSDFATIYNVNPLWSASTPIDGTGQTIAIVGNTNIKPADFVAFRTLFGLPLGNTSTPTGTQYLNIIYNGVNPGRRTFDDVLEASADTQWSGAVAKSATIDYVVSADTLTTAGIDLSALYIVDNNLAPVMSESYGACEFYLGTDNVFYNNLWQQASVQGITAMVSSADSGSAGCEVPGIDAATTGNAVNGIASTPWNIAVGGTDFNLPGSTTGFFATTDTPTGGSALAYIPEIPWNESCANPAFSEKPTYPTGTPEATCNINATPTSTEGAGGGPSSCITSTGSSVASCTGGYPKPAWQTAPGVPSDNARDLPDVSLFAAEGHVEGTFFSASYIICDAESNGSLCDLNLPNPSFVAVGGTSLSSPAFAGIMALVNQKTGQRQGNANVTLYKLFRNQVSAGTPCNSNASPSGSCLFNDLSYGTIAQACYAGSPNCVVNTAGDKLGILSGGNATVGYDTASGLGSVNAANLVNGWNTATFTPTQTTLTLSSTSFQHGSTVYASIVVTSAAGTPAGSISINSVASGAVTFGVLDPSGKYTVSTKNFPGGTYTVTAHYAGNSAFSPSDSAPVTVTVTPESSTLTITPELSNGLGILPVAPAQPYGQLNYLDFSVKGASGIGVPTGSLAVTDNGQPFDLGRLGFTSSDDIQDDSPSLVPGQHNLVATFPGDASLAASQGSATLTISKGPTNIVASTSLPNILANQTMPLGATLTTQSYGFDVPNAIVTFNLGPTVLGSTVMPYRQAADGTWIEMGNASVSSALLQPGPNLITAVFPGDSNYGASTSVPFIVTVTPVTRQPVTLTYTFPVTTVHSQDNLNYNLAVSRCSPYPYSGSTFTIYLDGVIVASGHAAACTQNSVLYVNVAPGQHTTYATYTGDVYYADAISATTTLTVTAPEVITTTSLTLSSNTAGIGDTVTATISVNPSTTPGPVTLLIGPGILWIPGIPLTNGIASYTVPTSQLNPGAYTVMAEFPGTADYLLSDSSALSLTVTSVAPTFRLAPVPMGTFTVARGGASDTTSVNLTPVGSYSGTVSLSCSGLPSSAACVFGQPVATLTSTGSFNTNLSFTAKLPTTGEVTYPHWRMNGPSTLLYLGLAFLGPLAIRRRRRFGMLALTLLISFGLAGVSACGSTSTAPSTPAAPANPGTPTGTYNLTVVATDGTTTRTSPLTLIVK